MVAVAPVRLSHLQALEIVLVKIFERHRHNPLGKVDAMSRKASFCRGIYTVKYISVVYIILCYGYKMLQTMYRIRNIQNIQ